MTKTRYFKATESFPVTDDDGHVVDSVRRGEIIHADHPLAKRYRDMLEPTDRFGRFDVEQTTAAPGEKRGARTAA